MPNSARLGSAVVDRSPSILVICAELINRYDSSFSAMWGMENARGQANEPRDRSGTRNSLNTIDFVTGSIAKTVPSNTLPATWTLIADAIYRYFSAVRNVGSSRLDDSRRRRARRLNRHGSDEEATMGPAGHQSQQPGSQQQQQKKQQQEEERPTPLSTASLPHSKSIRALLDITLRHYFVLAQQPRTTHT